MNPQQIRAELGKSLNGDEPDGLADCANEPDTSHYNVPSGSEAKRDEWFGGRPTLVVPRTRYAPTESGREILDAVSNGRPTGRQTYGSREQAEIVQTRQWLAVASGALKDTLEELRQANESIDGLYHEVERLSDLVIFLKENCLELKRFSGDDSWEMRFSAGGFGLLAAGQTLEACVENARTKLAGAA